MSPELHVPDEALEAAARVPVPTVGERPLFTSYALRFMNQAAPLVVAAELDRLISEEAVNVNESGYRWRGIDIEDLRRRAAELRGEGKDSDG